MDTLRLEVNNIRCNGCAKAIEAGLGKLTGVSAVEVDISGGIVTVSGDQLAADQIAATLAELGYPVRQQPN